MQRKMDELEANLRDITQRRLDFLEEAQKQQITMQVRAPKTFHLITALIRSFL